MIDVGLSETTVAMMDSYHWATSLRSVFPMIDVRLSETSYDGFISLGCLFKECLPHD